MKRAVIYARFSSDNQRTESIDAQVRACKEYCKRKQYLVTKVYADEAKSGRDVAKRDSYNQMLADALEDKFDVIVFHKLDRNARDEFNYYTFQHKLQKLGIDYEYAVQPIDSTPEGRMMEAMLVGMAAYYSRNLAKETKKGLNENAYKAMFNGGQPPLGYKIVDKKYVIEPREAEAVKLIYKMYLAGNGYKQIALELNKRGFKTREGRDFGKNSLYEILRNEKYMGTYTFNKTQRREGFPRNMHAPESQNVIRVEDGIPAIITEAEFIAAETLREENKHRRHSYKSREVYLLSGKIHCGICGCAMAGRKYSPRGKTYVYYCCTGKERLPACKCTQKQIRRDPLEDWIVRTIKEKLLAPESIEIIAREMAEADAKTNSLYRKEKDALTTQKVMAERKLDNIYKVFENGAADEYDMERLAAAKKELTDIKQRLKKFENFKSLPPLSEKEILMTLLELKKKLLSKEDKEAKKILIDLFVEQVSINQDDVCVTFNTKMFYMSMVPKTGLEPVRVSLPEGF